jgi:hypothetical protein
LLFAFGYKKVLIPALIPPCILLSKPPIAVTSPCKFISPVIATVFFIFFSLNKLYIAVVIAVPADGPSFDTAPSGQWICNPWHLVSSKYLITRAI